MFDESVSFDAAPTTDEGAKKAPSTVWENVVRGAGSYRLRTKVDDWKWSETDLTETRDDCVTVTVMINTSGEVDVYHSSCGTETGGAAGA
ncbi:hypothetical protein [Halobaculum sp. D14]|uniref:hypothetical protein n=1 Tax=Halobaculum sp. D14 TaxID=3421642 RepID=UPI003EC063E6